MCGFYTKGTKINIKCRLKLWWGYNCDLCKKVSSERSRGLRGMQQDGHQDSSSPQSQVHPSAFKLCLDISLKAWPLRGGLSILKQSSESPTGLCGHTQAEGTKQTLNIHICCVLDTPRASRNSKVLCSWYCLFVYVKRTTIWSSKVLNRLRNAPSK